MARFKLNVVKKFLLSGELCLVFPLSFQDTMKVIILGIEKM